MIYDDLLTVPFKLNGRDKNGMDCYGLCIELCRRNGKELRDLNCIHVQKEKLSEEAQKLNVKEITRQEAKKGDLIQCTWDNEIHIAFMLDKKSVIHSTFGGVRVTPILALTDCRYFRVV